MRPDGMGHLMKNNVFIHPQALCESRWVGVNTRIWAFAHILPNARIGSDCNICDHVFIENQVSVGSRVTIKCGVQLWDGVSIEDDVFIGPNATFSNDVFPRSRQYPSEYARTIVQKGASIGANATILPGIVIGAKAMVGAGAVVVRDVPARAIVVGNPARIVGYAEASFQGGSLVEGQVQATSAHEQLVKETAVRGVTLHALKNVADMRGSLTVMEMEESVPFAVRRSFLVYNVPSEEIRGEHAHRRCAQFLVVAKGRVHAVADDGVRREEFILDRPTLGLYLPPMTWGVQYKYSPDAVLLVLASEHYDSDDYIRDYEEFLYESTASSGGAVGIS